MEEKYQKMLDEVKAHIFSNLLKEDSDRWKERNAGIIHNTTCFSQPPPWENSTNRK